MIDTILTQEKELCKIRDNSIRQMAMIHNRALHISRFCLEDKNIGILLKNPLPAIPGLLGDFFSIHLKRCLVFFLENVEFRDMCRKLQSDRESSTCLVDFKKALLIPLRQSVGSCFATAFLIHLQKVDLLVLSKDLFRALSKGGISRILDGDEIRIPLCPKTGAIDASGAPIASLLMKSYEYTVAGLADARVGFSRWNFQVALGLDHEVSGGLGKIIYTILQEMLEKSKKKMEGFKEDIENLERGLDIDDASFRAASTIDRMDSIKRGAKIKNLYLSRMVDEYEHENAEAQKLTSLYKFFVEQYISLFPHYFQELYDPEMFSEGTIFEDRPAGFRLVYKHGRSNSKVWTYIYTDKEYIASLRDFITLTESILINFKRGDGLEKDIETIISQILLTLDTPEFLDEQKKRISSMHKKHLQESQNISPYAYIAGGNLESLINTFQEVINPIKKEKIGAQTPLDLCYSLIEFMKDVSGLNREVYEEDPFQGILMTNDTHAFSFLPGQSLFKEGWMHSGNTYTYIRDVLLKSDDPIVFADTNWAGKFLAFLPTNNATDFELVLYDGFEIFPFFSWDAFFKKNATWTIYRL